MKKGELQLKAEASLHTSNIIHFSTSLQLPGETELNKKKEKECCRQTWWGRQKERENQRGRGNNNSHRTCNVKGEFKKKVSFGDGYVKKGLKRRKLKMTDDKTN